MKLWVAILAGFIAAAGAAPAGAAPAPQPLAISIAGDGARATRLRAYDPAAAIAVSVTNSGNRALDGVTLVATGPAGESLRVPLVRAADGTFSGSLKLADTGPWQLRLTSRAGFMTSDTTPVELDVEAPPPSNAEAIGIAVGLGIFVVIGGGGFLLLRRTVTPPSSERLDNAA